MNLREMEMVQSDEFRDSDANYYYSISSSSECSFEGARKLKYRCYRCDDKCFGGDKCRKWEGQQMIADDDQLAMFSQSFANSKADELCLPTKMGIVKGHKQPRLSCSQIKQEMNFSDQIECAICSSAYSSQDQDFYECKQCPGFYLCFQCRELSGHRHGMSILRELNGQNDKENKELSVINNHLVMGKNMLSEKSDNLPQIVTVNKPRKYKLKKFLTYSQQQSLFLIQRSTSKNTFLYPNIPLACSSLNSSETQSIQMNQSKQNSSNILSMDSKASSGIIFTQYYCNNCNKIPQDYMYHCQTCQDYDLCKYCYWKFRNLHEHDKLEELNKNVMKMKREHEQAMSEIKERNYQNIVAMFTGGNARMEDLQGNQLHV